MLTFGLHEIENVLFYKKAAFDFNHVGLSVIYGANTNAGDGSSNGAGKSLILKTLPEVLKLGAPLKVALGNRKSSLFDAGTLIRTTITDECATYTITDSQKGKKDSVKTTLEVNGDDRKVRTKSLVGEQIAEIFPLTEDEFYTTVYIDSRRMADFQIGTEAKRFAFITNLFQLNHYDTVREMLNKLAGDARDDKIRHETISLQVAELEQAIQSKNPDELQSTLDAAAGRVTVYEKDVQAGSVVEAALRLIRLDDLAYVCKALKIDTTASGIEHLSKQVLTEKLEQVRSALDSTRSDIQDIKRWNSFMQLHAGWLKTFEPYTGFDATAYPAREQELRDLNAQLLSLQREWRSYGRIDPVDTSRVYTKEDLSSSTDAAAEAKATCANLRPQITEIDELLDHVHEDGNCQMCGNTAANPDTIRAYLEARRNQLKADFAAAATTGREATELAAAAKSYLEYTTWKSTTDDLKAQVDACILKIEPLQDLRKKHDSYLEVKSQEPKAPETVAEGDIEALATRVAKLDVLRTHLEFFLRTHSALVTVVTAFGLQPDSKDIDSSLAMLAVHRDELATLLTTVRATSIELGMLRSDQAKLAALTEQRDKINLEDAIILTEMIYAYSNKGMKQLLIRLLMERIEDNMNRWQNVLFRESFRFEVTVAENAFQILAYRGGKVSDIRELSGAESRSFNYLFPLACLPMIPSSRRVNFMILDEPEVNMDEVAKELFVTQFVPQLLTVIPHVIIATPLNTEFVNAQKYQARKVGDTTTLERI